QTFTSTKILFDESHTAIGSDWWTPGNASIFGWILMQSGYNVSTNFDESLDSGILDDYGVLVLVFPMIELTSSEIAAVHAFVEAGGGLLLVGVEQGASGWDYNSTNLNPISETYGISFNTGRSSGISTRTDGEFTDHHLTTYISSIHTIGDAFYGTTLSLTGAAQSVITESGNDVVATAESGTGRVIAVSGLAPFMMYDENRDFNIVDDNDHYQFSLNVIDWLAGNGPREIDLDEIMIFRLPSNSNLTPTEIEEYQPFSGAIHDHTTVSDGANSPFEMTTRALEVALDFLVLADHSYNLAANNGIVGATAAHAYQQMFGLSTQFYIGAELSSQPHTVGFPLTENIFVADTQEAVDAIHDQGAIAIFAHPGLSPGYPPVWERYEEYGYDAFEAINTGYFQGGGETAIFRNFIAASDGHRASLLGLFRNVFFVKNPTGPDGTISVADVMDAILNRRVVAQCKWNGMIFGDDIWVDRYLEIVDEAEAAIESAESQISSLESGGDNVTLARMYLTEAENAMEWWNPGLAIRAAADAISEEILGIDIVLVTENLGTPDPESGASFSLRLINDHDYAVEINVTPFIKTAISFTESSQILAAGPHSSSITEFDGTTSVKGYLHVRLNIRDLNTTHVPIPITLSLGGLIGNVSTTIEQVANGLNATIKLVINRGDTRYIQSASIEYDDGTSVDTTSLLRASDGYSIVLGPYPSGVNVTYEITVQDVYGNTFLLDGLVVIEGAGIAIDPVILMIVGGGIAALVVVVVIIKTKKGSSP
ncbi:MAG: hypothetical protein ACTSU3_11405, partial [Candidatus Thorarchaeota archaeon]